MTPESTEEYDARNSSCSHEDDDHHHYHYHYHLEYLTEDESSPFPTFILLVRC